MSNESSNELTHTDEPGGEARMVDVGDKTSSERKATARGRVYVSDETLSAIRRDEIGKGDVAQVGRIAGIMGSKKTSELIPLCHPISIDGTEVTIETAAEPPRLEVFATVQTDAKTGVEMEALTAVSTACLTLYDMCKSLDRAIVIGEVFLEEKSGGASGDFHREEPPEPRAIRRDSEAGSSS